VVHAFENAPGKMVVPLGGSGWVVRESVGIGMVRIVGEEMVIEGVGDFSGGVWVLGR